MSRTLFAGSALLVLLALLVLALPTAGAPATPRGRTVSPLSPTTRWNGASNPAGCVTSLAPSCASFALTITPPASGDYSRRRRRSRRRSA